MSYNGLIKAVSFLTLVIFVFTNNLIAGPDFSMIRAPMKFGELDMKRKIERGKVQADILAGKLNTPLNADGDKAMADRFRKGGYKQDGYGVPEGSAINGSFSFEGEQGYYAEDSRGNQFGKKVFLDTVKSMRDFFERRAVRLGKPIRFIVKTGIGGQHTPFQGIADVFQVINVETGKISGEYELGKDFETAMTNVLRDINADWDQIAVIPSSKSGSTDETMMVFVEIFYLLLKHGAMKEGINGAEFADAVLNTLHEVNFINGKERPSKDLFKVDIGRFGTNSLITLISEKTKNLGISREQVKDIFGRVLGNMFFETTDRVDQSRLSAFIRNSGLDKELGEDAPGFGAMFENVGGRWTGDLHMMTFLAYYGLDAGKYWEIRKEGIIKVNKGDHIANIIGNRIIDEGITDIALIVPDEFFWFGKSNEQNFNESIWQAGFANLITVRQSQWDTQKKYYKDNPKKLVINMAGISISGESFNTVNIPEHDYKKLSNQETANALAELFTTFYGITTIVGNRLIVKALERAGYNADDVDLNNPDNPATKIVQENLYLRQPFVELGKGFLEEMLKKLQEEEIENPWAIDREYERIKEAAYNDIKMLKDIRDIMVKINDLTSRENRKFVSFIYLEGDKFYNLRDYLISKGVEWVMQGTGDQHISYQQVLAQPQKYLPFIISFVPENPLPAMPAIGFAKPYLDSISPNMVRDFFAEASYKALTGLGGKGFFIRIIYNEKNINMLKTAITFQQEGIKMSEALTSI